MMMFLDLVLVIILPLWHLDPLDLWIALNLLSSSFSLSLFGYVQHFLPTVTRPGSLFGLLLFLKMKQFIIEKIRAPDGT